MLQRVKNIYHLGQAVFANIWYRFPGRGMTIIGVTGTDGKTTTASILYHILQTSGYKAACITTVCAMIDGKSYDTGFHVTTPSSSAIQSYLKKAQAAGVTHFVLETTSHALDQNRVWGVPFSVGVLTNITKEHLDYHKTYERYVTAKSKLFLMAKTAILNKDDRSYDLILKNLHAASVYPRIISYGLKSNTTINPKKFPFKTHLLGKFNTYNCLAAIGAAQTVGVKDEVIRKALATFQPPAGRQETVYKKEFQVIVDFAHTPNAFQEILPAVKNLTKQRLIHVFGAAGERDPFKRPLMGKISSEWADIMIITSEDPRNEPVEKITDEILKGIKKSEFNSMKYEEMQDFGLSVQDGKKYILRIPDRNKALETAVSLAKKGDVVIATGKSHEKSMNYGKGEVAWDEFETIKQALKKKH